MNGNPSIKWHYELLRAQAGGSGAHVKIQQRLHVFSSRLKHTRTVLHRCHKDSKNRPTKKTRPVAFFLEFSDVLQGLNSLSFG